MIDRVREYLREEFMSKGDAHDYWHMERVYKTAIRLADEEGADREIVGLAALLHDVADHKFLEEGETEKEKLRGVLDNLGIKGKQREWIEEIILNLSYKGGTNRYEYEHIEGRIVRDADRLDSLGAIGIARAFAYGGSKGRPLYTPGEKAKEYEDYEAYKGGESSTIAHFYEKLLKLKEGFYTESARRAAEKRHEIMEGYLEEFYLEWEGEV